MLTLRGEFRVRLIRKCNDKYWFCSCR